MTTQDATSEIRRACERLIVDSAAHNDDRDWSAFAGLFAEDALVRRPNGQECRGRDEIEKSYSASPPDRRTRHICANIRVDLTGPEHARAHTTVLIFSWQAGDEADGSVPTLGPPALGTFEDDLIRSGDGWSIERRVATLLAIPPTT
jgi:uncharacterized protein (TIGR02246 family)